MKKIISESIDSFGIPEEDAPLLEMANAIQKYTGLPGVIYFCTKEEMSNAQSHSLGRIKWYTSGESVFITIKVGKDGKRITSGNERLIKQLNKFVVINEKLLWEYWNTPKDEADSALTMAKFIKI